VASKKDPKTLKQAYASIFKGEMGKLVMSDLKKWCHIEETSYIPKDSHATAFAEGKRFIYLRIVKMAKLKLDKIMAADN